ncbi:hypothetical protein MKJ04_18390 [Pontibacter sp. E15-1]|uniref:hypothetical protein n=1 Tax=Pontibacter sp. E15-1 TaxID=2919918 RepID=UPI001F4FCED7|nr:hypothetical protein [Pontibacter sp. E15-1]MCJ8166821.1 hypothetical protein [Pontibacter sp. E15-1]
MSELYNPIFNNEREFLERQKEEYKNALMGDVDQIKSQGQEIGKKAAMAGGALLAGYLLKRMFSGGKKKDKTVKAEKKKKAKLKKQEEKGEQPSVVHVVSTPIIDYDSMLHEQEDGYTLSSERMHHAHTPAEDEAEAEASTGGLRDSAVAKVLTQQAVAFLLVYAGKKLEEYLHSVSENNDIAARPAEVTEIETTEYIVPKEDAI